MIDVYSANLSKYNTNNAIFFSSLDSSAVFKSNHEFKKVVAKIFYIFFKVVFFWNVLKRCYL